MSRRLSIQILTSPIKAKPKVKFTDELVFLDSIKDKDIDHIRTMLRRTSLNVDINCVNTSSGLTALHHAVLENSTELARLLLDNKAKINVIDGDSWTPLHAACAMGFYEMAKFLLENGANPHVASKEGERPVDLIDKNNIQLVSLLLNYMSVIVESSSKTKKNVNNDAIILSEHYENAINKIFKKPNRTTEALIDDISNTFPEMLRNKLLVSCLTSIICESCMNDSYQNEWHINTESLTKKLSILKIFVNNTEDFELESLYAVQNLDAKYNHPTGLLRNIFDTFYYCDLIKKDVFRLWRKSHNPYNTEQEHKTSLDLLKDFFNFSS